jgi:hypothetical protein
MTKLKIQNNNHIKGEEPKNSIFYHLNLIQNKTYISNKNKLHGLGPRNNYTDPATASAKLVPTSADTGVSRGATDPYGRILGSKKRTKITWATAPIRNLVEIRRVISGVKHMASLLTHEALNLFIWRCATGHSSSCL